MLFKEIIKMALSSLGVNKLRSSLTMIGITIGVFSVISVMTAIGALQYSIEHGISFLGSNIFQFAKYPANVSASGDVREKYRNRRNISYQQALHYYRLMEGEAREICLKCFAYEVKGQENDTEPAHCWFESQFSHRKCIHAWLRPESQ